LQIKNDLNDIVILMSQINDNLVELAYAKWAGYYSKRSYISNEPLWSELSEKTKEFWRNFVFGVQQHGGCVISIHLEADTL